MTTFWNGIITGLIAGIVAGIIIGFALKQKRKKAAVTKTKIEYMSEDEAEKAANIEKIKSFIADKGRFTNDDLEKLLGVSNTTIGRYLEDLESSGAILQHGEIGKYVYYTKK